MKYNIICHDGKSFEITEPQKEAIYKISGTTARGIDISGEFIFFGNIARIEKAQEETKTFLLDDVIKNYTKPRREKALQSMIKGFKKHFNGREIPQKSQDMLNMMIKKYDTVNR